MLRGGPVKAETTFVKQNDKSVQTCQNNLQFTTFEGGVVVWGLGVTKWGLRFKVWGCREKVSGFRISEGIGSQGVGFRGQG